MKAIAVTFGALLSLAGTAAGALYTENFEVNPAANWTTFGTAGVDTFADFNFDYSLAGIPSAPNSGGTTRGLKLAANMSSGVFGGVSASPIGQDFGTSYTLSFDWWSNFNGPFPAGGSGSTQLSTFGVGTAGATVQWPGGVHDSVSFAATGDGGSASDWRAYSSVAPTRYTDASGVYPAGSTNSSNAYYAGFGGNAAPAAQVLLYPGQTGLTGAGSAGMEWHEVVITKDGQHVTWTVDGLLIADINDGSVFGGGNIFFGHSDSNASSSTDVNDLNLLFTLIDNVEVTPEPATLALLALGGLALRRRR